MIPNTLKTGLLEEENQQIIDLQERLLALVAVLVKRAAITAALYCDHQGQDLISPEHITKALKVESMRFFDSSTLEQDVEEMMKDFQNIDPSPEGIVDHIISNQSVSETVEPHVDCDCVVCLDMKSIDSLWEAYVPEDEAKLFLKSTLDALHH